MPPSQLQAEVIQLMVLHTQDSSLCSRFFIDNLPSDQRINPQRGFNLPFDTPTPPSECPILSGLKERDKDAATVDHGNSIYEESTVSFPPSDDELSECHFPQCHSIFCFPTLGVAIPTGDYLMFNPLIPHCISSRCKYKDEIMRVSMYLKTEIAGLNNNNLPLNELQYELAKKFKS